MTNEVQVLDASTGSESRVAQPVLGTSSAVLRRVIKASIGIARARVVFGGRVKVGRFVRAMGGAPVVHNNGRLSIGASTWLGNRHAPVVLRTGVDGTLHIGPKCGINYGVTLSANASVTLGTSVSVAPYCVIDDTHWPHGTADSKSIVIGDGCWLATRVVVSPGVSIGDGSVITAGTHVEVDVPPGVVFGGAPGRVIRYLEPGSDMGEGALSVPHDDNFALRLTEPDSGESLRGLLISDFTIDPMARFLSRSGSQVKNRSGYRTIWTGNANATECPVGGL